LNSKSYENEHISSARLRSLDIILQKFGRIPDEAVIEIQTVMEDCYRRLSPHSLEMVDVILFENSSRMEAFSLREKYLVGAYSSGLEADFVATHEAWTGIPRILICYERLQRLNPLLIGAIIRHEVAHSVLHGSLEYYVFAVPKSLFEASEKYSLLRTFTIDILYLISMGVKDYEVTRLLLDHKYIDDQIAYSLDVLKTEKDDLEAWNLSKRDPAKMLLCLVARFKDLACVAATLDHQSWRNTEESPVDRELDYLSADVRRRLVEVSWALTQMSTQDTFAKVELVADLVVTSLMKEIFGY
jgi:hypothetical protein